MTLTSEFVAFCAVWLCTVRVALLNLQAQASGNEGQGSHLSAKASKVQGEARCQEGCQRSKCGVSVALLQGRKVMKRASESSIPSFFDKEAASSLLWQFLEELGPRLLYFYEGSCFSFCPDLGSVMAPVSAFDRSGPGPRVVPFVAGP